MPPRPDDPTPEPDGDSDAESAETDEHDDHDHSLVDDMRGSGVGVEDPNIVGDAEPGVVDDQVQPDAPPQV